MTLALVVGAVAALVAGLTGWRLSRDRTRRRADDRLAGLLETVGDSIEMVDERPVADQVVRRVAELVGADIASMWIASGTELRLLGSSGYEPGASGQTLTLGEGVPGRVWAIGEAMVIADVAGHPSYRPSAPSVRSAIHLPGHVEHQVSLVLSLESRTAGAFTHADLAVLQPIADLLAALQHSRRLISDAERLEDQLLTLVGHEMRTPLTTIIGAFSTLRMHREVLSPDMVISLEESG